MKRLLIVRHGQASFGQAHYDRLSALGIKQSERLGLHLKDSPIQGLVSGNLERQRDTLQAIRVHHPDVPWTLEPGWNEFDHREIFFKYRPDLLDPVKRDRWRAEQGERYDDVVLETYQLALCHWMTGVGGYTESWDQVVSRVRHSLEKLVLGLEGTLVVVTSAGPLSIVLGDCLGLEKSAQARLQTELWNSGISELTLGSMGLRLEAWNACPHLSDAPELMSLK